MEILFWFLIRNFLNIPLHTYLEEKKSNKKWSNTKLLDTALKYCDYQRVMKKASEKQSNMKFAILSQMFLVTYPALWGHKLTIRITKYFAQNLFLEVILMHFDLLFLSTFSEKLKIIIIWMERDINFCFFIISLPIKQVSKCKRTRTHKIINFYSRRTWFHLG